MKQFPSVALGLWLLSLISTSQAATGDNPEIQEILVSASLIPIAASRSANAITVIDAEQIKNRAALSVSDLLRDVPGLAVSRSGVLGSLTEIRARGAEANHLLVLIDGVEANDPSQGDQLNWDTLATDEIERIEVIRGPQSSMRGSDAIAGVVNIVTTSASQPFTANLYSEAGSWSTTKNGFSVGHKSEKFNIRLGASHLESEGANIILGTGIVADKVGSGNDRDGYRNTGINLKGGFKISEQWSLSFSTRHTDGMTEFDDSFKEYDDLYSLFNSSSSRFQADYKSPDGSWSHKISVAESDFENDNFYHGASDGSTESKKRNYQYIGSSFWEVAEQRISLALERESEEYKQFGGWASGNDANKLVDRNTHSVALEYRLDPMDSVTLAVSARHDSNDYFDSADTHRFEAIYQYSDSVRWRGAWGTAVKNPTFTELYGIYSGFQNNPNLSPEQSQSWELGFDASLLSDRLQMGATFFNAELEDEIGSDCDANWICTPVNIEGLSNREGVELTSSLSVDESLLFTAAYTYTDSTQADVDEVRRARHIGSINAAWQVQANTKLNLNIQHNGSQSDVGNKTLDAYTLVNLNANYEASDQLDVYLSLSNLFDKQYQEVAGYQTLGFGANLGLRYQFQ
ncbi:MAG: TonB-dependent receptor [Porticoccaceae bacterium]|nr:TonB-dependent receptor [Porticoccaceae bacterium]